jgi:hypothetical protein
MFRNEMDCIINHLYCESMIEKKSYTVYVPFTYIRDIRLLCQGAKTNSHIMLFLGDMDADSCEIVLQTIFSHASETCRLWIIGENIKSKTLKKWEYSQSQKKMYSTNRTERDSPRIRAIKANTKEVIRCIEQGKHRVSLKEILETCSDSVIFTDLSYKSNVQEFFGFG